MYTRVHAKSQHCSHSSPFTKQPPQRSSLALDAAYARKVTVVLAASFIVVFVIAVASIAVTPKCMLKQHAFRAITGSNEAWYCH